MNKGQPETSVQAQGIASAYDRPAPLAQSRQDIDARARQRAPDHHPEMTSMKHTTVKLVMESVNEVTCRFQIDDDVEAGPYVGVFKGVDGEFGQVEVNGDLISFSLSDIRPVERK